MKNSQKRSTVVVSLLVVIVILLGFIGYSYLKTELPQVSDTIPQVVTNQENATKSAQPTPKTSEMTKTDVAPVVSKVSDLATYSGKTSGPTSKNFTLKYPSSWTYYKFSCNAKGIAFWPKAIAPDFSKGNACSGNGFLESASIVVYTDTEQVKFSLNDNKYQAVFNQIKSSLSY